MKICILLLGTFGDMILATPIISMIKKHYPKSEITFIAGNRNHIIIKHHPMVDRIIIWNKLPHKLISNFIYFWTNKFDYYIDPKDHYSTESCIIARLVRAKTKIGMNFRKKIFDILIPDERKNAELHYTQRVFRAFESLGITFEFDTIPRPELYYTSDSLNYFVHFLNENGLSRNNYIVFNISASHPRKTFSIETLSQIFAQTDFFLPVVLTFDVKDTEKALNLKGKYNHLNLFFSRKITDVFPLIENSSAVITPDTSIVHIATAYLKPTLAFYSGLDDFFRKFHPNNSNCIVVRAEKGDPGIQSIPLTSIINYINSFVSKI